MAIQARRNNALLSLLGWRPTGDIGPDTVYTSARGEIIWFPRAKPLNPPTQAQITQRQVFSKAAKAWKALDDTQRSTWETATRRLSLPMTGYNLFTYFVATGDEASRATIEKQSGLTLTGLPTWNPHHPRIRPSHQATAPDARSYPTNPLW